MLLKGKRARIVDCAERKKDDLCSGKKTILSKFVGKINYRKIEPDLGKTFLEKLL